MVSHLIDTSIVVKWFHSEGEGELQEARSVYEAHRSGQILGAILDLGLYELGNFFSRAPELSDEAAGVVLEQVLVIFGEPIAIEPGARQQAVSLARRFGLSFYDASWAAAAHSLNATLVSADRRLLDAGLAITATECAAQL